MSYPPLSGYSGYYDANQQQSSAYSSNRQAQGNQYAPVTFPSDRQAQYSTSAYDWQGQGQQGYAQNAQQNYNNDQYSAGQQGQYEYGRDSTGYANQSSTSSNKYPATGASGSRTQSLQGLNNLAYASGLDGQTTTRGQQGNNANANYNSVPAPVNRIQSPMQTAPPQRQYSTTPRNTYTPTTTSASTTLQASAAQALAGAVSRKNQLDAAQAQSQRSASPYMPPAKHQRAPSQTQAARSPNVSKQRAPAASQSSARLDSSNSVSQATSISNLVTSNPESTQSTEATTQSSMPTYIDPSQVFNPYHREHERRRKEAAEAEVRRKEEEARQKEAEAQKKAEDEAAAKAAAAAAEAAKTQERQQKKKAAAKEKKKASAKSKATPTPAPEDDMATQMKMMMDKMKEFRQQDPSAFQKLWDEMRKGGNNAVAGSSNKAPSASPRVAQTPAPKPAAKKPTPAPSQPPSSMSPDQALHGVQQAVQQAVNAFQTGQAPIPEVAVQPGPTAAPAKRVRKEAVRPADIDEHIPLNGFKVVVDDNEAGLPDLGRFPAERRIRGNYDKQPGTSQATPKTATPKSKVPVVEGPALSQPLPAKNSSGGVEWPKDKREALAKAAIDALKAEPANVDVTVTPEDINAMLDLNPNYIDLCAMLEEKGLKFHRGQFARQLLSSVPDLSKAQKPVPFPNPLHGPIPPHMPAPPPGAMMPPPGSMMVPPPPPGVVSYGYPGPGMAQAPRYTGLQGVANFKREDKMQKRKSFPPAPPQPPPGSKEAMARKRDFSELVDLTQLSDNDDYVLSNKHPRLDNDSPEPMDILQQFQTPNDYPTPPPQASFVPGPKRSIFPSQSQPAPIAPPPAQKKGPILARTINAREALAKEYYDPKTVARDILIAAGRHPDERPLNTHMAGMLVSHIELDSDLSTFDWDAIDPGGPPMPKVAYVDIPAAPPRYRLGEKISRPRKRDKGKDKEKEKDQAGEDEDIGANPDSDKRGSGSATTSPALFARLDFRNKQRLDGKEQSGPGPSRLRESLRASSEASLTPSKRKASGSLEAASHANTPASAKMATPYTGAVYPSGKRRGRPPGSKNKNPAIGVMRKHFTAAPVVEIPASSTTAHPIFKCRFPRCGDELHNLETLRKHIRKKHTPSDQDLQEPRPYRCWWKKCPKMNDDGSFSPTKEYETMDELMEHLNETHLHDLALKFGDGPRTSPPGKL